MKLRNATHNSLIIRRLLPPPISSCNVENSKLSGLTTPLLHQAFASCGRVFLCLLLLLPFTLCGCEKESTAPNDDNLTRNAAADSTANPLAINLKSDTALSDTIDVYLGDDTTTTVTIAVPDSIKTMSAEFAASRRQ